MAHFRGFLALLGIDEMADLAFGVGRFDEAEPIAAGLVPLLGENFDHVAGNNFVAQGDHLAVDLRADALVSHFRVHGVREIDRRGALRQFQHAPLRREGVNLDGREIHLERGKKFAGLLQFLRPLDQLAHPGDALVIVRGNRPAVLIFPVCRDAFFGDAVHILRADLDFERLAAVNHSGVQRLVQIRPRHGDVVLEAAGHGAPDVVNDAKRGIAIALRIRDDANGEKIVNLIQAALLANNLAVQGTKAFNAGLQLGGNAVLDQLGANGVLDIVQKLPVNGRLSP